MYVSRLHLLICGMVCGVAVFFMAIVSLHIEDVGDCTEAEMTATGIACHGAHVPLHARQAAERMHIAPFIGILGLLLFIGGAMDITKIRPRISKPKLPVVEPHADPVTGSADPVE